MERREGVRGGNFSHSATLALIRASAPRARSACPPLTTYGKGIAAPHGLRRPHPLCSLVRRCLGLGQQQRACARPSWSWPVGAAPETFQAAEPTPYTPGCPSGPWDGAGRAPHAPGRRTALPALGLFARWAASSPTGSRERETNLALSVGLGEAPHTLTPVGRARLDRATTVQSPQRWASRPHR